MLHIKPGLLFEVLDSMQDMLRVLDLKQRVVLTNKSYRERFGEQCGKNCTEMFSRAQACSNCVVRRALKTGVSQQKKTSYRGRVYWVKASPLFGADGSALGTVEVFRDITSQVKLENSNKVQTKRLVQDAEAAAQMQRAFFYVPEFPHPRVRVCTSYLPASSMGGDMLGFSRQPDGRLAFYIADVSGHGFSAAMITLLLYGALRGIQISAASELLALALKTFSSIGLDEQNYVSMFAALLNPESGSLQWASAGFNAIPLLVANNRLLRLYKPSLPLCTWKEKISYENQTISIQEGSRLFLYTDGLLDRRSSRLTETSLEEAVQNAEGRTLIKQLEQEVLAARNDDVSMLLLSFGS
ncbi:MAG TPA: SpoIIE family protein phosphatase [Clostridia bacterium]|nr:SpoIIE family protein phosphatase [Clostridia bacterium]HOR13145.1 SpoIIE family protein phosphatase [Clostridia bacterium]